MNKLLTSSLLIGTTLLAACSSGSGPMFNAYSVDTGGGEKTFRVECRGVFEGTQTCRKEAEKICGNKPVHVLEKIDALRAADDSRSDPRVMTFNCGAPAAPDAMTPPPEPVAIAAEPKVLRLAGDANFNVDGATLNAAAIAKLDALLSASANVAFKTVKVTGYTDSTGSASHNLKLSTARSTAVMRYLEGHGLHADKYEMRGLASADPVASNATASGRAQNRRVEIRLDTTD
ncbi:OmpA family protein [Paraburkholderia bryophila]|uniref:Outer membrane protein OmpA-like peptidoglycan-associated protein n=1 Tax=Paraburkholderia bryophila TaxID=420952 RepID=A0A7Z0B0E1_9BURK|nr:OmpA family protein [Paraburkholderia bryophila]NYH16671.1 outer membrane protein OmpA-like peptidoglycan-associated protein [Paraburkholderia bryophila]